MKMLSLLLSLMLFSCSQKLPEQTISAPAKATTYLPEEGDVLFQKIGESPLPQAIRIATLSNFSHCGLVLRGRDGSWQVIEAIGPVQETPLQEWLERDHGHFTACRLKAAERAAIPAWTEASRKYLGRPYDLHFSLNDEAIYCSELVWKAWRDATGKELGHLEKLGDLNWLPATPVILGLEGHLPLERQMITPVMISRASELERIWGDDGSLPKKPISATPELEWDQN